MYEALYDQNRDLLRLLARRYAHACALDRAVSEEDLAQAGVIGLIKAAKTFDESAGKSWAGWASWYIRRECESALGLRAGRFTRAHTAAEALDRPIRAEDGDGATLGEALVDDRLPEPDDALLQDELRRGVHDAVNRLPDEGQRRAVRLCKLEGISAGAAAEALGVSAARVRRLYARACVSLSQDPRLRALADMDERTRFHAHKGVQAFNRDWTSVTEAAALWRVEQLERIKSEGTA